MFKAYIGERPECEDKINEKPVTTISRKFNGGALVIGAVDGSPPKELYCLPGDSSSLEQVIKWH